MYKHILVPYDKSDPAKTPWGLRSIWRLVCPAPRSPVLFVVVDWHDFNAETFKIASRMSGVMGDTMIWMWIPEVENEAIKADMDATSENIAPLRATPRASGCRGERLAARFHHGLCRRGRLRLHRHKPPWSGCRAWMLGSVCYFRAAQDQRAFVFIVK